MSKNEEVITYFQYGRLLEKLVFNILKYPEFKKIKFVYGIERGGLPISIHLSHFLKIAHLKNEETLPIIFRKINNNLILVVDDICDTGKTFSLLESKYKQYKNNIIFVSLFYKPHSKFLPEIFIQTTKKWVRFPWEPLDENPNREMYNHLIKTERGNENILRKVFNLLTKDL